MVFKRFSISLFLRVLLLAVLIAAFFYCLLVLDLLFSSIILALLITICFIELVKFVNKTNREMAQFLEAIRYQDFSNRYPVTGKNSSTQQLHQAFNLILDEYRKLKFEKELHANFLKTLVENVPVGILCSDQDGVITLYNEQARKIVGVQHLPDLSVLEKLVPSLYVALRNTGDHRAEVVRLQKDEQKLEITVRVIQFKLEERGYLLATLQNIKGELDVYEMEAWQKLIRVLTHEIMNSVTPIASLSSTLLDMTSDESAHVSDDLRDGMKAIQNRSQGLLSFVEHYRKFTRIPKPSFQPFEIHVLFGHLEKLYASRAQDEEVTLVFESGGNFSITADEEQIEQVMMNLLNNAFDAVARVENPRIVVRSKATDERPIIEVADNGPGIDPGHREKLFVPFFTTKEQGSGIGLSLSRQILLRNKANISYRDGNQGGAIFSIRF